MFSPTSYLSAATRNFTSGKSDVYVLADAVRGGFNMVLFTEPVSPVETPLSDVHALHRVHALLVLFNFVRCPYNVFGVIVSP